MAVAEGLAAKVGLSLGAAGVGATGIYFGNNYLNDYVYISKYERALIAFLNDHEDNDIVFEVKKGEATESDLNADDISFASQSGSEISIKVRVKVSTSNASDFKKGGSSNDASNIDKIKKLGDGDNWTWECPFNFTLVNDSKKSEQIKDKDRIFKDTDKGLFGILKKDLSNYSKSNTDGSWTKSDLKRVKTDFIRQCGNQRSISGNKELSKEDNKATDEKIKIPATSIKFTSDGSNLVPEDKNTFDYWFKDEFKDRQHATGG